VSTVFLLLAIIFLLVILVVVVYLIRQRKQRSESEPGRPHPGMARQESQFWTAATERKKTYREQRGSFTSAPSSETGGRASLLQADLDDTIPMRTPTPGRGSIRGDRRPSVRLQLDNTRAASRSISRGRRGSDDDLGTMSRSGANYRQRREMTKQNSHNTKGLESQRLEDISPGPRDRGAGTGEAGNSSGAGESPPLSHSAAAREASITSGSPSDRMSPGTLSRSLSSSSRSNRARRLQQNRHPSVVENTLQDV
jgi:hypothetical protein